MLTLFFGVSISIGWEMMFQFVHRKPQISAVLEEYIATAQAGSISTTPPKSWMKSEEYNKQTRMFYILLTAELRLFSTIQFTSKNRGRDLSKI